jgi:lauroyl/myristoyl acyltransferase
MNFILYWFGRGFIAVVQMLPLPLVARIGRLAGALAYSLDARHRRVVLQNLMLCFGPNPAFQTAAARSYKL